MEQEKLASPSDDIHRHLKDEYILEFLDLSETFSEKELRKAILENLRNFFLEFGAETYIKLKPTSHTLNIFTLFLKLLHYANLFA